MTDLDVRAARIRLYGLVGTLALAVLAALAITTGSFVVSFAVQTDLVRKAMLPPDLAWIIPAGIDTTIFIATICLVVLSKMEGKAAGRFFFAALLLVVIAVSVWGNGYHAYLAAERALQEIATGADLGLIPLNPTLAAGISVIPPLLVLAWTHGIALVVKAIGDAYTEYNALVASVAAPSTEPVAFDAAPVASQVVPVASDVALAAPVASDVALAAPVASDVALAAEPASGLGAVDGPEQTVENLLAFIAQADELEPEVKETARLKIEEKKSFAVIAEETGRVAGSTALRRYQKAEKLAREAGYLMPPLPNLGDGASAPDIDGETPSRDADDKRELVAASTALNSARKGLRRTR